MANNHESRRRHAFYCPVSPHIAWSWGLEFQECPVISQERDSDECRTCPLRGNVEFHRDKGKPKRETYDRERDKDKKPSGRQRQDGAEPKKGKTFVG